MSSTTPTQRRQVQPSSQIPASSSTTPNTSNTNNTSSTNPSNSTNTNQHDLPSPSLHTALVHLDAFNLPRFIREMFLCYRWSLLNYPIYTKSITSATIAVLGECLASHIKYRFQPSTRAKDGTIVSYKRLGVFGLYGLLCTGPMLHYWYTFLEYVLTVKMRLTGHSKIAAKLLIDRAIWGPPFVLFTVSFLQLLQTLSPQKTAEAIRKSYMAVLIMNQKVWVPGQWVNFTLIPVDFQVLFVNAVNVGWNTYLSMAN